MVYLRMGRAGEAVAHLALAVDALDAPPPGAHADRDRDRDGGGGGGGSASARTAEEVLGNYAAALRKVPPLSHRLLTLVYPPTII